MSSEPHEGLTDSHVGRPRGVLTFREDNQVHLDLAYIYVRNRVKEIMPRITPVPYRRLTRLFERDGWRFARQKGDHLIYTKRGNIRPLVIPMYDAVPVFIIKNLLRSAGMTRDRYFELLEGE